MKAPITDAMVAEAKKKADDATAEWLRLVNERQAQREGKQVAEKVETWDAILQSWLKSLPDKPQLPKTKPLDIPPDARVYFAERARLNPIPTKEVDPYESWKTTKGDFIDCVHCKSRRIWSTVEDWHKWANPATLYSEADNLPFCSICEGAGTEKTQAQIEWEAKTPLAFREGKGATVEAKFPDQQVWDKLSGWTPVDGLKGRKSLYVCGKNRCGKSRMMFELLRRRCCRTVLSLKILLAGDFRQLSLGDGKSYSEAFVKELQQVDVLAFDDFDKSALTDTNVRALFAIMDYRLANLKPTIMLSNYTPRQLANIVKSKDMATQENIGGIVNRIFEFCNVVEVKP